MIRSHAAVPAERKHSVKTVLIWILLMFVSMPSESQFVRETTAGTEPYLGEVGWLYRYSSFGDALTHEIMSNESCGRNKDKIETYDFLLSRMYFGFTIFERFVNTETDVKADHWIPLHGGIAFQASRTSRVGIRAKIYVFNGSFSVRRRSMGGEVALFCDIYAPLLSALPPLRNGVIGISAGFRHFEDASVEGDSKLFAGISLGVGKVFKQYLAPIVEEEIEKENYEIGMMIDTPEAWREFLTLHPDSKRRGRVESRIKELMASRSKR